MSKNLKRPLFYFFMCICCSINLAAQERVPSVTGLVRNASGTPLPFVTINALASDKISHQTTSDTLGKFKFDQLPAGNLTVEVSSVGYTSQTLTGYKIVNGQTISMLVDMQPAPGSLEEVVVVGYGNQKKVNLTGSISTVAGVELANKPVGQTSTALQGIVPGLTIMQRTGQPGFDGGVIRIRGIGTLGDPNPLIILDGVESDINNIEPNDIESITVLKDASSAAIYGARAANGVILITTKRGNKRGVAVNYNSYVGIQSPTSLPDVVNALDHMELTNEASVNVGNSPIFSPQVVADYKANAAGNPDKYPDTDWQDLTLKKNAMMQSHYIGINAGGERVKMMGSFSYLDQDGIMPNVNFKRYNVRFNTDIQLNRQFSGTLDLSLRRTDIKQPPSGAPYIFQFLRSNNATNQAILSNGLYGEGNNGENPLARAAIGGLYHEQNLMALLNLSVKYKPANFFWAEVNYAPRYSDPRVKIFSHIIQMYKSDFSKGLAIPGINSLSEQFSRSWYNNLRATVNFDKEVAPNHRLTVLAGVQQEDQSDSYISAYRQVFTFPDYQVINSGNQLNQSNAGSATSWALRSAFGRLNYNYKEKYLFEANARYDGSSRFAAGNKYAFFPSVSAGWRISKEAFMDNPSSAIKDLKLRGSWGQLGNQNIGLYPYVSSVSVGSSNYPFDKTVFGGAAISNMANKDIQWETSTVSNIGLDLNLWSKLTITADYYYRKTTGILLQLPIPGMLGLSAPYQNAGVVENRGWDVSVNYRNRAGAFTYGVTLALSDVKNKILDMRGSRTTGLLVNFEGSPIGAIYGYEAIGYFTDASDVSENATQFGKVAAGDIKYKDLNGDKVINSSDQKTIGSTIPRYSYSAHVDLGYKGFDFSLFLQGVGKADGYMGGRGIMPFWQGGTALEIHKDRWTPTHKDAAFPRLAYSEINNIQNSSFWVKNAAYMRVKNIQLGYSFKNVGFKKIQQVRLFVSAQNLITFDKYWDGYDVEAPVTTEYGSAGWYPQMKVITAGLNINF